MNRRQLLVKPDRSAFFGIDNPNPDAALAEEMLQSAIYDAQRLGLDGDTTVRLVMRFVEAGKDIAAGGTGRDPLEAALRLVVGEITEGGLTRDRATNVLTEIEFVLSIMG